MQPTKESQKAMFDVEPMTAEFDVPVRPHEAPAVREEVVDGIPVEDLATEEWVEGLEKAVDLHKRMLSAILGLTNPTHWVNMGKDKYYLQAPGAEALCKPLRIAYDPPEIRLEIHRADMIETYILKEENQEKYMRLKPLKEGEWYAYWVEGYVASKMLKQEGLFTGYCDSKDQFFNARPGWKQETGAADVKKSAMSNFLVNAVTRLAGIRSPDPEMLKAAGLNLDRIQIVNFSGARTAEQTSKTISEPQSKRLWAISRTAKVDSELLKTFVKEVYGLPSTDVILIGQYEAIVEVVQKGPATLREKIEQAQAKKAQDQTPETAEDRHPGEEG